LDSFIHEIAHEIAIITFCIQKSDRIIREETLYFKIEFCVTRNIQITNVSIHYHLFEETECIKKYPSLIKDAITKSLLDTRSRFIHRIAY